jgi:hypothetical protein
MPGQALHGRKVRARVEHVPNERTSQIVRRKRWYGSTFGEPVNDGRDRLLGEATTLDAVSLVHCKEERAGLLASHIEPSIERIAGAIRYVRLALLVALAAHDERPARFVEVAKVEGDCFSASQTAAVEQRNESGVPSSRSRRGITCLEERAKLTTREGATLWESNTTYGWNITRTSKVLGVDEPEPECGAKHSTEGGQHSVRSCWRVGLAEIGANGGDVGVLHEVPGERHLRGMAVEQPRDHTKREPLCTPGTYSEPGEVHGRRVPFRWGRKVGGDQIRALIAAVKATSR